MYSFLFAFTKYYTNHCEYNDRWLFVTKLMVDEEKTGRRRRLIVSVPSTQIRRRYKRAYQEARVLISARANAFGVVSRPRVTGGPPM